MADAVVLARVSDSAIDPDAVADLVRRDADGAVAVFHGVVRDHDGGRGVTALEYDAHPTAEQRLRTVADAVAAASEAPVRIAVQHRTGALGVGDTALVAAVASAHRAAAFAACERLVDDLKREVPIWKRQRFDDGGTEWVGLTDPAPSEARTSGARGPWRRAVEAAGLLGPDGVVHPTVFARLSALAAERGAINLGQGFPDYDGPAEVLDAARQAIAHGANQYPPGRGIPELRTAIAAHQHRYRGLAWDADREVLVTAGATEAIAASLLAFVDRGDEVVVVEPFYDSYAALVGLAGGRLVTVPARSPGFRPDPDELVAAISDRTAVVLLNSPHNPTGAMLPRETLAAVLEAAERHDAIVVADEVYEHLAYDEPHVSIGELPGARERAITISSAAKTFRVTGWKIGWITAAPHLVEAVLAVKQFLTYVNGAPFQPAIAAGLALPDAYFRESAELLRGNRDLLRDALSDAGFGVSTPPGGYFLIADGTPLGLPDAEVAAARLLDDAGIVAIPVTAFTTPHGADRYRPLLRVAFCKNPHLIEEAATRIRAFTP